jgi:hypothetical protein
LTDSVSALTAVIVPAHAHFALGLGERHGEHERDNSACGDPLFRRHVRSFENEPRRAADLSDQHLRPAHLPDREIVRSQGFGDRRAVAGAQPIH